MTEYRVCHHTGPCGVFCPAHFNILAPSPAIEAEIEKGRRILREWNAQYLQALTDIERLKDRMRELEVRVGVGSP